jgi:hypothetical protein
MYEKTNTRMDEEVAIFSYDLELGIPSIDLLARYYDAESDLPCTVIEGTALCGIRSRQELMDAICETSRSEHC